MDQVTNTIDDLTPTAKAMSRESQEVFSVKPSVLTPDENSVTYSPRSRPLGARQVRPRNHRGSRTTKDPITLFKWLLHSLTSSQGWLLALVILIWGLWNGKLLVSTGAGVLMMILVYRMQDWDWQSIQRDLARSLGGSNRQLTLAVGCGGLATLGTYMALSIWADSSNPWMASGMILQNVATLSLLGWLLSRGLRGKDNLAESRFQQMLTDLTNADPMTRLIAVRQLTNLITKGHLSKTRRINSLPVASSVPLSLSESELPMTEGAIADCFRLMLSREPEEVVREAVLDALQVLDRFPHSKS